MKKILIIDDNLEYVQGLRDMLEGEVHVLGEHAILRGIALVNTNPDAVLVAIDGRLERNELDSLPLVKAVRHVFRGPLVAIASDENERAQMVAAGCDLSCPKDELEQLIRLRLGLPIHHVS